MAPVEDAARLDRLLQKYPGDADVAWLVERCSPHHSRIQRRDSAIRAAVSRSPGPVTTEAKALSVALLAHYRTAWMVERYLGVPDGADERHRALHEILRLNGGKPLGYRRIIDICK